MTWRVERVPGAGGGRMIGRGLARERRMVGHEGVAGFLSGGEVNVREYVLGNGAARR